jgi:hypothetical protein
VSDALLTFLSVVAGGLLTGGGSLLGVHLVTTRERDARRADREQERNDRRDTFRRETLLSLQDAIEDTRQSVLRSYDRKLAIWKQERRWERRGPGDPWPKDWSDADAQVNKLWARLDDTDLESMVQDFLDTASQSMTAQTQERAFDNVNYLARLAHEINARVGVVLDDVL